jgi:hypothetical protein
LGVWDDAQAATATTQLTAASPLQTL